MRWRVLATLVLAGLPVVADGALVTVALPSVGFGGPGGLVWVVVAYAAGFVLVRRGSLRLGLLILTVGSLVSAMSPSLWWLVLGRLGAGVGAGMVLAALLAALGEWFDPAERGRALAIWAGFTGLVAALSPVLSGLLLKHFWWGSVFVTGAACAVVALVCVPAVSGEPRSLRAAPLPLVAFFALGGTTYVLTFHLQDALRLSPLAAGLRLLVPGVVLALASPLLARHAPRHAVGAGLVLLVLGLVALDSGSVLLPLVLVGAGTAAVVVGAAPPGVEQVLGAAAGAAVLGSVMGADGDIRSAGLVGAVVVAVGAAIALRGRVPRGSG